MDGQNHFREMGDEELIIMLHRGKPTHRNDTDFHDGMMMEALARILEAPTAGGGRVRWNRERYE